MKKQNKAIFLDKNATINSNLIQENSFAQLKKETISALLRLQKEYILIVVSEQNKKNSKPDKTKTKIDYILQKNGINISAWHYYTSLENKLIKKNFNLDTSASWIITDKIESITIAENEGIKSLYLLTERGTNNINYLSKEVQVFHNLTEATDKIFKSEKTCPTENYCSLEEGARIIKKGGLTAFPTETVYGLGADVFQPNSVRKIFELKKRPFFDPLITHINDIKMLELLTDNINPVAKKLIEKFWPGPLTLVFKKKDTVDDVVTGGNPTVAVRMPAHPIALKLIKEAGTPIAAPSANSFGKTSPTTSKHVIEQLGTENYVIIEGGACRVGVESTVLSLTGTTPIILRQGGLPQEEIEIITGPVKNASKPKLKNLESPGLLDKHYAPKTQLIIKNDLITNNNDPQTGLLIFGKQIIKSAGPIENLSPSGSLKEAAVNLYAAIRRLDKLDLDRIITFRLPDTGIGRAINDRLLKSSTKK